MILHIVSRNKNFTTSYICFHERNFGDRENYFFAVSCGLDSVSPVPDLPNVYTAVNFMALLDMELFKRLSEQSEKMIVSGIWEDSREFLLGLPQSIADKTYLQFWGGDFYGYRKIPFYEFMEMKRNEGKRGFFNLLRYVKYSVRNTMDKAKLAKCIKRCRCCIVLIEGDTMKLRELFPQARQVLVAPMGGGTTEAAMLREGYRKAALRELNAKSEKKIHRIIVGNSATRENHHLEAFEMLKGLDLNGVEIICPLSYGNMNYAKIIREKGQKLFGEAFHPLDEMMEYEKYIELLAGCDVGIFNNDRQQAMGNITTLLAMGRKVYMRPDTSMWERYRKAGYRIFDINELKGTDIEELFYFEPVWVYQNEKAYMATFDDNVRKWEVVLNS